MFKTHDLFSRSLSTPRMRYGFFSRKGGVSEGIFQSLNCGYGSADDTENVAENRKRAAEALQVKPEKLLSVRQIHSVKSVVVTEPWTKNAAPEGDAMVTDQVGLALGVLTADCAPVLFAAVKTDNSPVIGAAHAGWRGALGGVLQKTRDTMIARGALPDTISAVVGPCLGPQSYEVGKEFSDSFIAENRDYDRFFTPLPSGKSGKCLFDLPAFVLARLQDCGIKKSYALGIDTYPVAHNYFSYRRNCHAGIKDYGRQISIIAITE